MLLQGLVTSEESVAENAHPHRLYRSFYEVGSNIFKYKAEQEKCEEIRKEMKDIWGRTQHVTYWANLDA